MKNVVVLKCGGSMIDTLSDDFFKNIERIRDAGLQPIIVHGGGPAIKKKLDEREIEAEFVDGLRKTTKEAMGIVEMTLTGLVNNAIVRKFNDAGIASVGLSGSDANLLRAKPKDLNRYGYVGEVSEVNVDLIDKLVNNELLPVIAPIGIGADGTSYNINADTAAGAIAKAVGAKKFIFITDVPGILKEKELLPSVTETEIEELIDSGTIYGGMIPKVEAALESLGEELTEAMIVDGNQPALIEEEMFVGTVIKKTVEAKENESIISNI